jgi:hypothetical protein
VSDKPDLTEVIGDALLDYYGGYGLHPASTRPYGAAAAVVAALGRRRPDLAALLDVRRPEPCICPPSERAILLARLRRRPR